MTASVGAIRFHHINCWEEKSITQKLSIIALPSCLFIVAGLFIYVLLVNRPEVYDEEYSQVGMTKFSKPGDGRWSDMGRRSCVNPSCFQAADRIFKYGNQSLNPCQDFYNFACDGYLTHEQTDDGNKTDTFIDTKTKVQKRLQDILETDDEDENDSRPYRLLKQFYRACMNTSAIELDGIDNVKVMLKDMGGWPVLDRDSWNEKRFDWQKSITKFRKYGLSTNNFVSFNVENDIKNASQSILHLDEANLDLDRDDLIKENHNLEVYEKYMVDLAVLFEADRKFAESEVKDMINFKQKLANITSFKGKKKDRLTINKLQRNGSNISWIDIINQAVSLSDKALRGNDPIMVPFSDYTTKLEELLQNHSTKRQQANHAIFQAISSLVPYLPERFRQLERNYNFEITGEWKNISRSLECTSVASKALNLIAESAYVNRYYVSKKELKNKVSKIVLAIKHELLQKVAQFTWMDNETIAETLNRIRSMSTYVDYPNELLDDEYVENFYDDLKINTTDYLHLVGNISLFKRDKTLQNLYRPLKDKGGWTLSINLTGVNAFIFYENGIETTAAVLESLFFDETGLEAVNFAGIGTLIGYKLVYGIVGSKYNAFWSNETLQNFNKTADCFLEKYLIETRLPQPNVTDFKEKLYAQNFGSLLAYWAYGTWVKENPNVERDLPGMNYTDNQLFWITIANLMCKRPIFSGILEEFHHISNMLFFRNKYFDLDFSCKNKYRICKFV